MKGHTTRRIIGKRSSGCGLREDLQTVKPSARIDPHLLHTP
jgi:hypothetical protein